MLLGAPGSSGRKAVIAVAVALLAIVVGISISAIVLSVRAIHEQKTDQKVETCYYKNAYTTPEPTIPTYQPVITLIRDATVWTGVAGQAPLVGYDILIVNGTIREIAQGITNGTENAVVYNVNKAFVTPGIVDMHSHVGVNAFPNDAHATQDTNEMTNPDTPQVRVIDAIDPNDPAIPLILSGGVTTSLILPGSANLIGGQGLQVKMKGGGMVADMAIAGAPLAFKMATGENPKRVYGAKGVLPSTRMGNAWGFRRVFADAALLKQQQDQWDCIQQTGNAQQAPRPSNARLDPLVSILRQQAIVNVHCYEVQDFESVLRVADEFGFKISAFHHALEAYRIPEVFFERNITIATFADHWGFKMEAYNASVWSPSILRNASVQVAIKSDHPVIYAKFLIHEAVKAYHYGLSEEDALRSITAVPAVAIGLGNRVGTLEVGKDGDVVVWNSHPLIVGAKPTLVFIEGVLWVNNPIPATSTVTPPTFPNGQITPADTCQTQPTSYAVSAGTLWTMETETAITNGIVVVTNGVVTCANATCDTTGLPMYNLPNGVIIPGIVSAASAVGLSEVEQEPDSQDGTVNVDNSGRIHAADGLRLNAKHVWAAWAGGVTSQVAAPQGTSLITGTSAAFYTHGTIAADAIYADQVAVHIAIGNAAKKSAQTNSVSGQFAALRTIFRATDDPTDPVFMALNGTLPFVFYVDQADEIGSVLRLKTEFNLQRVVIIGGAEAAVVAPQLAAANVHVVLAPSRAFPAYFETERSTDADPATIVAAGVPLAIAETDAGWVRNLRWNAGYAQSNGLSYYEALASITSNVAQVFSLPSGIGTISPNTQANLVLFDGDPLVTGSKVALVALGTYTQCYPQQL